MPALPGKPDFFWSIQTLKRSWRRDPIFISRNAGFGQYWPNEIKKFSNPQMSDPSSSMGHAARGDFLVREALHSRRTRRHSQIRARRRPELEFLFLSIQG